MRNVEKTRLRGVCRGVPVLGARRYGAKVPRDLVHLRLLIFDVLQPPGLEIDAGGRRDRPKGPGRQHLPGRAVENVNVAVPLGPDEDFSWLAVPIHVEQDLLVDPVPVVEVVWAPLVKPARLS